MADLSTRDFPHVYASLKLNVNSLGVVMQDVEPIHVNEFVTRPDPDLYYAADPEHYWVRGSISETGAHVTLLYGLLASGQDWKAEIDEVLRGWSLDEVEIEKIGYFESNLPDEDYICIVAHIKVTDQLLEGHKRLSFLPHINTFAEYRPHVTIAYVKPEAKDRWLKALKDNLIGKKLATTQLNYGGKRNG